MINIHYTCLSLILELEWLGWGLELELLCGGGGRRRREVLLLVNLHVLNLQTFAII